MGLDLLVKFSVVKEEDISKSEEFFSDYLGEDEIIELAYSHVRDKVIFTNKKIICYNVQGLTGSKKEIRIFQYSKIVSFSVETAGFLDFDSDFKIWISGVGVFEIKFGKNLDIKKVGTFLSRKIS